MNESLQVELNSNIELFQKLRQLEFSHLLVNTTLVAGFKVRNKIGGPVMLVQGFITTNGWDYYFEDNQLKYKNGTWTYRQPIYPKVQLNSTFLTQAVIFGERSYKRNPGTDPKVPNFLFFENILDFEVAEVNNSIYVICKFWSENKNDFNWKIENLYELEFVQD